VATEWTWPPRVATTSVMRHVSIAWGRRRVRDVFALVAFVGFTAFWFHALLLHLGSAVLLGPSDETSSIRQYWAAQYLGKTPFTLHRDPFNGAPEGLFVSTAVQIANGLIPGTIWLLHYVMGLTAAENTFLLSGFALTGFAVYLLLDRLGLEPVAAIYAGFVVAFNPWMLERAYAGHHGYMQAWVFPVLVAALLWVRRTHRVVAAAAAGAALTLTFYASSYYGLLAALVFGVFFLVDLFQQPTWRDRLWSFTLLDVAAVTAIIVFLPALIAWRSDQQAVAAGVTNPVSQLQSGGASLSSYVLPWWRNPALGGITTHFYPQTASNWSANGMNTLYIGWSLIALAAFGAVLVIRRDPETMRTATLRFFLVCSLILVPAAFICSLKRKVPLLGIDIPMPAYFVGQVTTFWRIFARFGVLVTFSCAILAAVALTVALRRFRRGRLIAIVAFALIALEYTAGLPPVYRLSAPPWATWLRAQPAGSVANYPMPTDKPQATELLQETYFQQVHSQHPQFMLFGSGTGGTREDAIRLLARYVTDPLTPGILKAEGVKYVLLHDDVYRAEGEQPPGIPADFHLVAKLPGDVRALALNSRVEAADLPAVLDQNAAQIALVQGLPAPSLEMSATTTGSNGARVLHGESTFDLSWNDPRLKRVQVLIHASSQSAPTSLELLAPDGRVLARSAIGAADTLVSWGPIDLSGSFARFELRTAPATPVELSSIQLQPLADVTTSIRDVR